LATVTAIQARSLHGLQGAAATVQQAPGHIATKPRDHLRSFDGHGIRPCAVAAHAGAVDRQQIGIVCARCIWGAFGINSSAVEAWPTVTSSSPPRALGILSWQWPSGLRQ
jgi:hypothetical protein